MLLNRAAESENDHQWNGVDRVCRCRHKLSKDHAIYLILDRNRKIKENI